LQANQQPSPNKNTQHVRLGRLLFKTVILFVVLNLIFSITYPVQFLGGISAYNLLFPGRARLPYGDNPQKSYNLNLYNLEAMFASHEIHRTTKETDEFRVILIGDSATWGFLLPPEKTTTQWINQGDHKLIDGRQIRAYNLGYPVMSLTKDLMMMTKAMAYHPDLIVWAVTLESFPYDKQLFPPLLQNNASVVRDLIQRHHLNMDPHSSDLIDLDFMDKSIVGSRRALADLVRLQLYGVMWAATGIDQEIPDTYTPALQDLSDDLSFHNLQPPHLDPSKLALDVLKAGFNIAGETPILLVNEPMLVSQGENSDLRYNFFYPRWVYDDYRQLLSELTLEQNWQYLDLWDSIPADEFTNSAVHLSPAGSQQFADMLSQTIIDLAQSDLSP
jgi:hypothetical protein